MAVDPIWLLLPLGASVLSILFAIYRFFWIGRQEVVSDKLIEIGSFIRKGAMAFLAREYKVLIIFVLVVAAAFFVGYGGLSGEPHSLIVLSFIVGALFSGIAGYMGMNAATKANTRTAYAAQSGIARALTVAFTGGSVMGLIVVGLGLLGLSGLTLLYMNLFTNTVNGGLKIILEIIPGYSFGASSVALFARVGGGIFTKAADVGADLVGKVEAGIPEDDPRNPATIADNVGDNVGDVAGLGSDLCESYIASIIGAVVLGGEALMENLELHGENSTIADTEIGFSLLLFPIIISGIGILVSILGTFFVRTKESGNPQTALNLGTMGAGVLMLLAAIPAVMFFIPDTFTLFGSEYSNWGVYISIIAGVIAGVLIGIVTEYYTADDKKPVMEIAKASGTGPATNIITGIQVGMLATGLPVLILGGAIAAAYYFGGLYGIAIGAVGMLATTGVQLAVDAYGPIADNAGGLAEMAAMDKEVRKRTDKLDAVGNTTAAIGKGFAIGSAALTALALFVTYQQVSGAEIDATKVNVVIGLLFGAMLPYVFTSFVMGSVGKAAFTMIEEVRTQFRNKPGILTGDDKPDYVRCVDIATKSAIREMVVPGLTAIIVPLFVGFVFGANMLGGVLVGVTLSGVMLALFMANSGGAWDNAKKHIEGGAHGGKGSEAHKASVIGDTVGDPFKDTAGPAMDILIKLMSVVALVIAPIIANLDPVLKFIE